MRAFRGAIRENLALALLLISRHLTWIGPRTERTEQAGSAGADGIGATGPEEEVGSSPILTGATGGATGAVVPPEASTRPAG
jgi:hypothetical protein